MSKFYSTLCKIGRYALVTTIALQMNTMVQQVWAQKKTPNTTTEKEEPKINSGTFSALKFRSIGPAYTSGRISDFAVNPNNHSEYYVAVSSGNVWKTVNKGQTFEPVFDDQGSYSTGVVVLDPNNSNVVWVGTGENNHQRALGYGDGVYKSLDGGKSWKNMGLKNSRQIGGIVIDPRNSNTIFVAAEGSAWGPGGERGLYKSVDGGNSWKKVIDISENTGVNNVIIDPKRQNIMYATSEQRRRHVHTKIGGGPESAVYKSEDNGETWRKLTKGLPSGNVGGMGIAISPVNPDYVFIIAEAEADKGGFFRSTDRGESWSKMSSYASSGQYYNEIVCDPIDIDKIYSTETVTKVTLDGGKTWNAVGLKARHVDDHALWIDPTDTKHFMIGGDGGIYETYDSGENFRHISNLSVTQFYRVGLDNSEPFYWVYGGTQDNNSMGGPSNSVRADGVPSEHWITTIGGDGFFNRIDPKNPNIVYSESQYGNISRFDKLSGEQLYIRPQPAKGELTYRWNWNAPFIISHHNNEQLYMAANKVFRSTDRGHSWKTISDDVTAQLDRTNTWQVMGKYWPTDAVAKDVSTSLFGTVVAMEESPVKKGLLFIGTDDGLIQFTDDANADKPTWTKLSTFPGVPANTYVSDIFASRFDENIVYASFSNLLRDDFKPYLLMSTDKGKTWVSITDGLPENGSVHTIEQDFVNKDLLFCGTEFGVFFSNTGGKKWIQLKSGIPTIAVYDMAIQQRETDLVLATFGRGMYVLDNYSPLRTFNENTLNETAKMFPIKDALVYIEADGRYGQGSTYFLAKNKDFGATFTYFIKDIPKTDKENRQKLEKDLFEKGEKMPVYDWKTIQDQDKQLSPYLIFRITDEKGNIIRNMTADASKGLKRIVWDLKYENNGAIRLTNNKFTPVNKGGNRGGILVMPGKYFVSMLMVFEGKETLLTQPEAFIVKPINNTTLPAPDRKALTEFQLKVSDVARVVNGTMNFTNDLITKVAYLRQAALQTPNLSNDFTLELQAIDKELDAVYFAFYGVKAKASDEEIPPMQMPLAERLSSVMNPHYSSTSAITQYQIDALEIVKEEFTPLYEKVKLIAETKIPNAEKVLELAKAGYTPGRLPVWTK